MRENFWIDQIIYRFDKILKTLPKNASPLKTIAQVSQNDQKNKQILNDDINYQNASETPLSVSEKTQSAAFMRINHSGEVCAQALYLGQALMARDNNLANQLYKAAEEEEAHLTWCRQRIIELNGKTSFLNPLLAIGAFGIGVIAGLAGDKISLGFLAETENQVTHHLEKHLNKISKTDIKSIAILEQMREDEKKHATHAIQLGGINLPKPICKLMTLCSKIMTTATRYF